MALLAARAWSCHIYVRHEWIRDKIFFRIMRIRNPNLTPKNFDVNMKIKTVYRHTCSQLKTPLITTGVSIPLKREASRILR
jgi:hypothetical protein